VCAPGLYATGRPRCREAGRGLDVGRYAHFEPGGDVGRTLGAARDDRGRAEPGRGGDRYGSVMTVHRPPKVRNGAPTVGRRRRLAAAIAPPWRALATGALGLFVLAGVGRGLALEPSVEGGVEQASALWTNPVPSLFTSIGAEGVASRVGLLRTEPPRVFAVPEAAPAVANRGAGSGTGSAGSAVAAHVADAPNGVGAAAVAQKPGGAVAAGTAIKVFFARHPDSDAAFTAVYPVARAAPDRGVAAALAKLIEGPTADERAAGYYSELGRSLAGTSSCGGRDLDVGVRDGVATVRLCRAMTSGGVGQDARVRAQIEATLKQFATVRSVRLIGADGRCLLDRSGLGRCLANAAPGPRASAPAPRS